MRHKGGELNWLLHDRRISWGLLLWRKRSSCQWQVCKSGSARTKPEAVGGFDITRFFCSALLFSPLLVAIMSSTVRTEETNVTSTNLAPAKAEKDEQVSSVKAGKSRATDENADGDDEEEEEEYNEEEDEDFVRDKML